MQEFEFRLLRDFTCRFDAPWVSKVVQLVDDMILGAHFVALLVLLLWLSARGRGLALRTLLAVALAIGGAHVAREAVWRTAPRVRPATWVGKDRLLVGPFERSTCASLPDHLVSRSHPPGSPSFPSSHAVTVGAIAAALTFVAGAMGGLSWIVALAAWLFALAVGMARLWLTKHWPSDILGGFAIGLLAAWPAWRLSASLTARMRRRSENGEVASRHAGRGVPGASSPPGGI